MTHDATTSLLDLNTAVADLEPYFNPEALESRLADRLANFDRPDGIWRHAPAAIRAEAEENARREWNDEASVRVFRLQQRTKTAEAVVEARTSIEAEPLDAESAWAQRTKKIGFSMADGLLLTLVDETRRERIARELADVGPAGVLQIYERAASDPTEQQNATTVRYIETRYRSGWSWPQRPPSDADVAAANRLHKAIDAARAARVKPETRHLAEQVAAARRLVTQATGLRKIVPRRPRPGEAD